MHKISWWKTSFGGDEVQKLAESVSNEHISQGPVTEEFEARFADALGVPYALATTSGSVALLMALIALGVGRDDEVIVPDRTYIATAHPVLLLGAKVVLVDVRRDVPAMDVTQIRRKITTRTKAIMPVHLNGRAVDMPEISRIAVEYGLPVIEDTCQAMFSKNKAGFLGTQSDAGCFSLSVTKLISTGQGGVVVTRSQETYEKLKLLRNHGVVDNFTETWDQLGFNFKYTDLLASFGLVQLERVPHRIERLRSIYSRYMEGIGDSGIVDLIPVDISGGELPLYIEALADDREELMAFFESKGIQTRRFPPSLHTAAYLDNAGEFPWSDSFADAGIYLPCGPEQPLENIDCVVESLLQYRG